MENLIHFFLFGNPRSGTSLLRLMLHSHPAISVPPECGFAEWLVTDFSDIQSDVECYAAFAEAVVQCRKFETWNLSKEKLEGTIKQFKPSHYFEYCLCVYLAYAEKIGKNARVLGDKNNYYLGKENKLAANFPDSKKVLIIRDGRDVACSYRRLKVGESSSVYFPNLPYEVEDIANEWRDNAIRMRKMQEGSVVLTRYEDLLDSPESELSRICNYLGLSFDRVMLRFYESNDEPAEFLAWKNKLKMPLQVRNKNRYKEYLSPGEIGVFHDIAGDLLAYFGYSLK